MSYCVNCGVELRDSERSCPLCNVPVSNPIKPWTEPRHLPYPRQVDRIIEKVNRSFGVVLASLLLLIPAVITVITNLLTSGTIDWSAYVVGSCFLVYVFVLTPMQFKKPNVYLFIALDTIALLVFLQFINYINGYMWFWRLALPIVLIIASVALVIAALLRSKSTGSLIKAGVIFLDISILCIALNIVINAFLDKSLIPNWALYAAVPCIILSIVFFYTDRHQAFKEKIQKRLFY
jgi:peptidoglycan/LPS O-acetylase OafA/YrhL